MFRRKWINRRNRRGVAVLMTISAATALAVPAASSSQMNRLRAEVPSITWTFFQSAPVTEAAVIGSQKSLQAQIPAHLKFIAISNGPAALAAMRAGSYQVVEGVGNPPVVSAIANGTKLRIVWIESYDGVSLYVNTNKLHSIKELKGQAIGVMTGSTQQWEITGWLAANHLSKTVDIVPFPSEGAAAAAYLAGKIDAIYVSWTAGAAAAKKPGTKEWTTAAKIAKLGYPAVNVVAMPSSFVAKYPALTQKVVCTIAKASRLLMGADRDRYIAAAADLVGMTKAVAIAGSHNFPLLSLADQTLWFGKAGTPAVKSPLVTVAYKRAAVYLKSLGAIPSIPTSATLASAIDARFVRAAANGACG